MLSSTNSTVTFTRTELLFQACFPVFSTACLELAVTYNADHRLSVFSRADRT